MVVVGVDECLCRKKQLSSVEYQVGHGVHWYESLSPVFGFPS